MRNGNRPSRRHVLAAATGAACALAGSMARTQNDELPIVDTHQHLWDLKRFRLPWLDRAGNVLNRTYTTDDYLRASAGLNIAEAVYMEVDVEPAQRDKEADFVVDLCRRKVGPTVAAVIGGATERDDFPAWISRFKDSPYVKGVRSSFDAGVSAEAVFVKNLRTLGSLGMSFDINVGPSGLDRAASVVKQCPDTRFIVDHCGNVDATVFRRNGPRADAATARAQWEKGISTLSEGRKVLCKISGVMEAAGGRAGQDEYAAVFNHCLKCFGPDRVMFASNWPIVNIGGSFASWVALLRSVVRDRPAASVRKLFSDNAIEFYGLRQA
jgi:predicted TIM-barrel fold metal-dependent hydrolase